MAAPTPGKKRKLANNTSLSETPKRPRKTQKSSQGSALTPRDEPSSVATDRTYRTAQSSSDVDDLPFVTPKASTSSQKNSTDSAQRRESMMDVSEQLSTPLARSSSQAFDALGDSSTASKQQKKEAKKARRAAQRSYESSHATPGKSTANNTIKSKSSKSLSKGEKSLATTTLETSTKTNPKGRPVRPTWGLSPPSGGCFLDQDAVFVQDADQEYVVVATSQEIQLLSLENSLVQATWNAPGALRIQHIAPSAVRTNLVYILYNDGSIFDWDLGTRSRLRCRKPTDGRIVDALAVGAAPDSTADVLYTIATTRKHTTIYQGDATIYSAQHDLRSIQIIGNGEYVIAHGSSIVLFGQRKRVSAESQDAFVWVEVPVATKISCLDVKQVALSDANAGKQSSLSVVVGNVEGQLHLYDDISNLFSKASQRGLTSPRVLHWHREAVLAVKFSRDGNYLISGGKETVLVLWQLGTGGKQFLPHLNSTIEHIVVSPAGHRYAIGMGDNSVMVLSTSELKPVANLAGLQLAGSAFIETPVPAVLDPTDETQLLLVVPSTQPGPRSSVACRSFLQTFDVRHARHVTRQALSRNNTTDFNLGPERNHIAAPDVKRLQVSSDGQWLATVDEWLPPLSDLQPLIPQVGAVQTTEHLRRLETYLKFWKRDTQQGLWTLTTRFDAPHPSSTATPSKSAHIQVVADPAHVGFASLGQDDCVRVWRPKARMRNGEVMRTGQDVELTEWSCKRTIELPLATRRADTPVESADGTQSASACLAWSQDGSILVVAQTTQNMEDAPVLHFIDVNTGTITTKSSIAPEGLVSLEFLDRCLIAMGHGHINIWDIVDDKLSHHIKIPTSVEGPPILASNTANSTFIVSAGLRALIFQAAPAKVICEVELDTIAATILPQGKGYIVLLTDGTIRSLVPESSFQPRMALSGGSERATADAGMDIDMAEPSRAPTLLDDSGDKLIATASRDSVDLDDRPVVRPEQLADILETSQSFAMLSVRDMFHAVAGLYGRQPEAKKIDPALV